MFDLVCDIIDSISYIYIHTNKIAINHGIIAHAEVEFHYPKLRAIHKNIHPYHFAI